ncbi:WD40 repeat-like protein [Dendrothele bispora CBS 962.96]|uniref:WD40 repeat-like protein n=1 Tax=Dendrothele bispora (strain CBS 962.96) TaxID=1314807 RepID=A0A4S8L2G4_DENBC|nr:WD40 repeat-like protein [Dendrothele bispora CBS 962.96]
MPENVEAASEWPGTWNLPKYDVYRPPHLEETLMLPRDLEFERNFMRLAKWCPDGSMFLGQCENRSFQLMTTKKFYASISDTPPPTRTFTQPAPIVDFAWYPTATPRDAASFCFVASVRDCPVKLLDAQDGRLRASYPIIDHRERFIAPHSMAFNLAGQKLYCGFEDAIEVFEVGQPGEGTRLATTPSKKSRDGLKGIISALAFSPSYETDLFAAGSLTPRPGNIALFSESQGEVPVMFIDSGPEGGAGVTQIRFNPIQPHILYASFRRRRKIYSWDLRATGSEPLGIFDPALPSTLDLTLSQELDDTKGSQQMGDAEHERDNYKMTETSASQKEGSQPELTNQRISFDVDIGGSWLGTGGQDGVISIFDTSSTSVHDDNNLGIAPVLKWSAAKDSISSVSFNYMTSALLAVSGSRHFDEDDEGDSEGELDDDEDSGEGNYIGLGCRYRKQKRQPFVQDPAMRIWAF